MDHGIPDDYVKLEKNVCVVCAQTYETNGILISKRLKSIPKDAEITGWGMCPEHEELRDKGYVALVAIDENLSSREGGNITPATAYRLGAVAHIAKEVFDDVFDTPAPDHGVCFTESAVIDMLEKMQHPDDKEDTDKTKSKQTKSD